MLSLDEGFGRTPFEAVASGCKRIILSDIEIFRETFDHNAMFLPLNDVNLAQKNLLEMHLPLVADGFELPFDVLEGRVSCFLEEFLKKKN